MKLNKMSPQEYLFVRWMNENHPALLAAAEKQLDAGRLGALTDSLDSILSAVNRGLDTYVRGKESVALVKLNIQRAKQGLTPVTDAGLAYSVSDADMRNRTMGIPTWVLIGGAGVALYLLLGDR